VDQKANIDNFRQPKPGNTEENVGFFMDYKRKSQPMPAPCPIKAARRSKIIR